MYSLEPANFSDYRDFLKFRFENLKTANKNFTLQACATRSGLSKSHIQFLLKKERHITLDKFPTLAKTLKINSEEEYFVYLMICKNSSKNMTVQNHFEDIMKRIRHQNIKVETTGKTTEKTTHEHNSGEIYKDGISMLLKSLVRLDSFVEDPAWIKNTLDIESLSIEKINILLKHLEEIKAVKRGPTGKFFATDHNIFRPDPYDPNGFDIYSRAAEFVASLMKKPHKYSPSVYSSMSLAMDEENLLKTEKLMIETHHKLCELAKSSKSPTSVAFIGNFFMTVARGAIKSTRGEK